MLPTFSGGAAVTIGRDIRSVKPLTGAAPYIGGKRNLAKRIIAEIEKVKHTAYVEPFIGMGGIFFRRRQAAEVEVINDYSRDVANFFRVLQRHYVAFIDMMRWQLTVRAEFERLTKTDPATLTDLERAARFYYLQQNAFGGKVAGRTFGVTVVRPGRFDITRLVPQLEDLHTRLASVVIECLDFEALIQRYDRPVTLFYLDPPYHGSESDYGSDAFSRADFTRLERAVRSIQGRFILSINDTPETRELFSGYKLLEFETTYSVGGPTKMKKAAELLVLGGSA
jgi:DNA adenine methylase